MIFLIVIYCASLPAADSDRRIDSPPAEAASINYSSSKEAPGKRFFLEVYGQSESSSQNQDNTIFDAWIKGGVRLFDLNGNPVESYLKARIYYDINKDFWNNRAELGGGLRWRPIGKLGMVLFGEVLGGLYTGREGLDANPYDRDYLDVQAGMYFWQRWGKQGSQAENQLEFYLPFTGWHELYGEAIYYRRDMRNVIGTADYKESLMYGKLKSVVFEFYLNLEVGIDSNRYYWNNYSKAGPGVRIYPFKNIDMQISAEYFWGNYWDIEPEHPNDRHNDFVITAAFWKGF